MVRLSRMVEEMSTEHAQLQAERDRLGAYVDDLLAQPPPARAPVADTKAQVCAPPGLCHAFCNGAVRY